MTRIPTAQPASAPQVEALRRQVRDRFDRWARSYDRSWLNELAFYPAIRACQEEITRWQAARGRRPYRLLDVGCGTGRLITWLAAQPDAELLVGLDYSRAMVGRVAEKIAAAPHAAKLQVVVGDAQQLPLADESFDVVTCCHSLHHYPHQAAAVRGFRRVLRAGGLLILVDGFRDNVIGWVVYDVAVALAEAHVHHAGWSQVREMLRAAGFVAWRQRKLNVLAPLLVVTATR